MTRPRTIEQLSREIKHQLRHRTGWERLYEAVNGGASMITAISDTEGDDWVNHVKDFSDSDKQTFRNLFHPHLDGIRSYLRSPQQGGADTPSSLSPSSLSPSSLSLPDASPTSLLTSAPQTSSLPLMPDIDLDAAFTGLVQKTDQFNQTAEYLSSQYGLTRIERDFDQKEDFHVVPEFLRVMIGSMGPSGIATKQMLDKLTVPYRFIVFIVYLSLDLSRLSASTMGHTAQQKTLTVILALLELFRGDWKKAILTFMGFYGTTPLLAGQMMKTFLYLFERLSPTFQISSCRYSPFYLSTYCPSVHSEALYGNAPNSLRWKTSTG
jgi:hypothetical protein